MITLYYKLRAKLIPRLLRSMTRRQPMVSRGPGAGPQLCAQLSLLGFERVLLVTDRVLLEIGVLDPIKQALESAGTAFEVYDGVQPDPTFEQVQAGEASLRACAGQAVLAVGGGSVLDTAKMISLLYSNGGSLDDFAKPKLNRRPGLPLFAIPTTAGTGSEVTPVAVITNQQTHEKTAVADAGMMPAYVALDPAIMRGMPPGITAATGMDALTHAVESFLSRGSDEETERQATAAVRLIFHYLPVAWADGDNLEARDAMALAAYYAGAAFSRTSVGYAHAIAHQLGRVCGTPHGNANAMVLPEVLLAYGDCAHARLAELARRAGLGRDGASTQALAQTLIDAIVELRQQLDLPLLPRGLKHEDLPGIVREALSEAGKLYPVPRYLSAAEVSALVRDLLPATQPQELELSTHGN